MFKFYSMAVLVGFVGCSTTEEVPKAEAKWAAKQKIVDQGRYVVSADSVKRNPRPLPNLVSFNVRWKSDAGEIPTKKIYRGWDVDRDGQIDMLEVTDKNDMNPQYFFDFNGDGKIDMRRSSSH